MPRTQIQAAWLYSPICTHCSLLYRFLSIEWLKVIIHKEWGTTVQQNHSHSRIHSKALGTSRSTIHRGLMRTAPPSVYSTQTAYSHQWPCISIIYFLAHSLFSLVASPPGKVQPYPPWSLLGSCSYLKTLRLSSRKAYFIFSLLYGHFELLLSIWLHNVLFLPNAFIYSATCKFTEKTVLILPPGYTLPCTHRHTHLTPYIVLKVQ